MAGKRVTINSIPINFTCENARFKTDISISTNLIYPGSVTENPIYVDEDGKILILERVIDKENGNNCFWFMWYTNNGIPLLTMSGVIDEASITEVIRNISKISF